MILFLIGKGESVNKDLLTLPISIHRDGEILYNIYNESEIIHTVVVSKQYVSTYGFNETAKSLIYLSMYRKVNIIYKINVSDKCDEFIDMIKDLEPLIIRGDIQDITKEALTSLQEMDSNVTEVLGEQTFDDSIDILVKEFFDTSDELKDIYLQERKYDIIDILSKSQSLMDINKSMKLRLAELESENLSLDSMNKFYQKSNIDLIQRVKKLEDELSNWTDNFIRVKDAISAYNEQLEGHVLIDMNKQTDSQCLIIQFKELDDIKFVQYFTTLCKLFTARGVFCKSIIFDDKIYRDYNSLDYKVIGDDIEINNFVNTDCMIRYSSPKKLAELIVSPEFNLEVLFVLDRTSLPRLIFQGDKVFTYFIGNHKSNYTGIDIEDTSFISPYEGDWINYAYLLVDTEDSTTLSKTVYQNYAARCSFSNSLWCLFKSRHSVKGLVSDV